MTYRARLIDGGRTDELTLAAGELEDARVEVVDALSRIAAEGRPLPTSVEVITDDNPALTGELAPRKGCCSGWEITWRSPDATSIVATDSL